MWPFDMFRRRAFEKRRNAALLVLLGHYGFRRLDEDQRKRVEAEVARSLEGTIMTMAELRRCASWHERATYRGVAMALLGIQPNVPGLAMRALLPRTIAQLTRVKLSLDFLPMHPATASAKEFLRGRGFEIPDADPWEAGALDPVAGSSHFWKETGLRKELEKRRDKFR